MIELTALKGSSPIGAMAAYGVLRILHLQGVKARLQFDHETTQASLDVDLDAQELIDTIKGYIEQHDCAPDYDVPQTGANILASEFGPALYVEQKDKVAKSIFNRVAGSDNVLNLARKGRADILKNSSRVKSTEDNIKEALFGPWLQNDAIATFGWNPADKKEAASLAGTKVPKSLKHRTVVAANWLAFESLPLLAPLALISERKEWCYPVSTTVDYNEACALMYGFSGLKDRDLKAMQVSVYQSTVEYYSQSASCFTESVRVA